MGKTLLLTGLLGAAAIVCLAQNAPAPEHERPRRSGTVVRIELIGDSTPTDNAGYGRGFCANLTEQVDCLNMSKGGASTKTFREQGLWDKSLETKPDYMLIQFGHNDMETPEHLERQVPMAQHVFGRMVAVAMGKAVPQLNQYVKPEPAILPAEGVLAMKVLAGAPFTREPARLAIMRCAGGGIIPSSIATR